MKKIVFAIGICAVWLIGMSGCTQGASQPGGDADKGGNLLIGWSSDDITPDKPVVLRGQFHARFSEGILDPLTVTALAMESTDKEGVGFILVSCDLISIPDEVRNLVRTLVTAQVPELSPTDITLNGTHTHTAPAMSNTDVKDLYGIPLEWMANGQEAMTPKEYLEFVSAKIADAVVSAWKNRSPGGISYGLSKAVLGHNRLAAYKNGKSQMYGDTGRPEFSHIEGYEDHNLNLLYTWDKAGTLTGVIINAAVTTQVTEQLYQVSADFWTEARALLRQEIKSDLYVLPQVSAAGDQSPHYMWDKRAEERMQKLMGFEKDGTGRESIGHRKQIARYITDGVKAILPYMKENIEWSPVLDQKVESVPLSRRLLNQSDVEEADKESAEWSVKFNSMLQDVTLHPEKRKEKRWYKDITIANTRANRGKSVRARYEAEKANPKLPVEVTVVRIGDMAIATNPFELYLDYGIQMKVKSPAIQTFVVELAGGGTYLPTQRSIDGGAYGAVPASTIFGPQGGAELVDKTVEMLHSLWPSSELK